MRILRPSTLSAHGQGAVEVITIPIPSLKVNSCTVREVQEWCFQNGHKWGDNFALYDKNVERMLEPEEVRRWIAACTACAQHHGQSNTRLHSC